MRAAPGEPATRADGPGLEALVARWNAEEEEDGVRYTLDGHFPAEGDRPEVGAIMRFADSGGSWGSDIHFVFAVRHGDGYRTWDYYEGTTSSRGSESREPSSASLVAPGWIRVDYTMVYSSGFMDSAGPPDGYDGDDDEECLLTHEDESHLRFVALCRVEPELRCRVLTLAEESTSSSLLDCEGERPEWADEYEDEGRTAYALTLEANAEGARLRLASGDAPERLPPGLPLDVRVSLDDALASPDE